MIELKKATAAQKLIAKRLLSVAPSEAPSFTDYWDDKKENSVVIFRSLDTPEFGLATYSTVGLCESELLIDGKDLNIGLEIITACRRDTPQLENIISSAAFCVINSKWACAPGVIFPDILSMYNASNTLSDLYFCPPFLWNEMLDGLVIDGKKVAWLLAVPISKSETEFASQFGPKALEDLFEKKNIDIFNINRDSVV